MAKTDFSIYQKEIAKNLRLLLEARGISGKRLSEETGIPDPTINRYLNGVRVPKIDNIIALSYYFAVPVGWLCGLPDDREITRSPDLDDLVRCYTLASDDDRAVVDAVLAKYKRIQ